MPIDYVLGDPVHQQNGGILVRLADNALNSVAFIAAPSPNTGEMVYGATGFFVKYVGDDGGDTYFITARHVAERVESSEFMLRMGSTKELIDHARWYFADEGCSRADVAVTPYTPPRDSGVVRFPSKHFLTKFKMESKRIGPGDQVHIVGLYRLHKGDTKNRVVVHTGHIAMMPDDQERYDVRNWHEPVEGYAVEAQTLDGLSGSPVFVRRSIRVMPTEQSGTAPLAYGAVFLLGLWMASWEGIPDAELAQDLKNKGYNAGWRNSKSAEPILKVPVGMGVVVPAYHIMNAINCKELREMRQAKRDVERMGDAATLNASLPT